MKFREWITVLFLGVFIGICTGYYLSSREIVSTIVPLYQRELKQAQDWNGKLVGSIIQTLEKDKKGK